MNLLRAPYLPWLTLTCVAGTFLAGCATPPPATTGAVQVPVFFATTRSVMSPGTPDSAFGGVPTAGATTREGLATVTVSAKGATITSFDPPLTGSGRPRGPFYAELRSRLETNPRRPLIAYVHGYNNTFADAAHRAALFTHELQADVAASPVIYSWPSAGSLFAAPIFSYPRDEDNALLDQDRIREFLSALHGGDGGSGGIRTAPVILIGHSMGARALTYGLRDLFEFRAGSGRVSPFRPMFAQLVLLEPDVNRAYFLENLVKVRALCGHITVYASSRDRALQLSNFLHGQQNAREGQLEGSELRARAELAARLDIIDTSAVPGGGFLHHSYDSPPFFDDLRLLIQGHPAVERVGKTLDREPGGGFKVRVGQP